MRSFTPTMQARLGAAHLDSAWVIEIDWPDGTTGRYADRPVQIGTDTYLAVVSAWGRMERSADGGAAGGSVIDLIMSHADALWTDLRVQEVVGAVVRFGLHAIGTSAADIAWLWGGTLARLEAVSDLTTRLHVHSALEDLPAVLPVHIVDSSAFPDARPDVHGRALPLVYGQVPHLPALAVRTSAATTLRGAIAATSTSLEVEDASAPVAFPSGAVIVRIDDEYVAGSFSGNTFTITQRGAAAVTAAVVDSGTDSTLVDAARTEPDGAWVGFLLEMTGGTAANIGLQRTVIAFDAATDTVSVALPFPAPVAPGDTYTLKTRAADHLHGAAVELVGQDDIYLVADHPCVDVADIRLNGHTLATEDVRVNRYDLTSFPALGRAVTTITTRGRARAKQYAEGSRFLLARFDADGGSSAGVAWANAIDPRPTFVAQINAAQPVLALQQTTDMADGPARYGAMRGAFLVVHFRQDRPLTGDRVDIAWNSTPLGTLDTTQSLDHQGGGGEVDLVHTHPQDLSHPVAPVARVHEHVIPGQLRQVDPDADTGNAFSSVDPKTLARNTIPPHAGDELIQTNIARFTITISSDPIGFDPFGIFRLHYKLPYGPFLTANSVNGALFLNVTADISGSLNQWENWPNSFNRFQFWVENIQTSRVVIETYAGLWEVTIAPRNSQPSTTFLETETTDLPAISLDGTLATVQNTEDALSVVYENIFDLSPVIGNDWSALNAAIAGATYAVVGGGDGAQVYIASMYVDVEFAPFSYTSDGLLTATVQGVDSAGDGTGTLLTNPADIVQDILTVRLGLPAGRIDAPAFAQAFADADATGARWDFALSVRERTRALLPRLAAETHGRVTETGGVFGLRIDAAITDPPVAILTSATRVATAAPVQRSGGRDVANVVTLLYAEDYRAGIAGAAAFTESVTREDGASIGAYARRPVVRSLRFVRDAGWAAELADTHLAQAARPGLTCEWPVFWHELALEGGDVVWLTDTELGFVDAPGRIVGEDYRPGAWQDRMPDAGALRVQLAPWRLLRVFDNASWLVWSDDGLRVVIDGVTVARITLAGDWWIAGRFIRHASLAAGDPAVFETYDASARTLYYSDTTGARLLEIDASGNVRAAGVEQINAPLGTVAAAEGTRILGDEVQWIRGDAAPNFSLLTTLSTTQWRLAGRIIQQRVFPVGP